MGVISKLPLIGDKLGLGRQSRISSNVEAVGPFLLQGQSKDALQSPRASSSHCRNKNSSVAQEPITVAEEVGQVVRLLGSTKMAESIRNRIILTLLRTDIATKISNKGKSQLRTNTSTFNPTVINNLLLLYSADQFLFWLTLRIVTFSTIVVGL